jgi:hypothetical protein
MQIVNGTIDCWLYVNGRKTGETSDTYFDFQHHHWDIGPSGPINNMLGNRPSYTWTLTGNGHDDDGHWSATGQSRVSNAVVRTDAATNPTSVNLTQSTTLTNRIWVGGSNNLTNHNVYELTWPPGKMNDTPNLAWSPTLPLPAWVTYQDAGRPTNRIEMHPLPGLIAQRVQALRTLVAVPGMGGRDYTSINSYFFQKPAVCTARAWWAWNINLS